jgi:hypothetical protein
MNYLIYNFNCCENEGTKDIQSLNAEVSINRDPVDSSETKIGLDLWVSFPNERGEWEGKPELPSFDEKTAMALRDFLVFCFPIQP